MYREKWGISQLNSGIGKYFSQKDAETSLREMSEIANLLADECKQVHDE